MKLYCTIIFFVLSMHVLSQKYDTLFLFNECSFSLNQSHVPTNGHGDLGFDVGLHRIFENDKLGNFVYGLEFSKVNYFLNEVRENYPMHYLSYYHSLSISKMAIRNSFNYRFHLDESKNMYFSTGAYIDYVLARKVYGFQYQETPTGFSDSEFKNNNFKTISLILGLNAGFGYNFNLKYISIGLQPQVNISLLPFAFKTSSNFENRTTFRMSVIFRKLHRI